jgi:EF-hand domain pair
LRHWGLSLTEEQFKDLFRRFDVDGDGRISYEDFMITAGSEINPMEYLYFRQDIDKAPRKTSCKHAHCWNMPSGLSEYCGVHLKMMKEKAT